MDSRFVIHREVWEKPVVMSAWELNFKTAESESWVLASWLFLRLLGLIYLAAFVSLATQIRGLVGRAGILPAAEFLDRHRHWGFRRFYRLPTLCWLGASDGALSFLCWGGAGLAMLLTVGLAPLPVSILLWIFHLSLFTVCRIFLCYQWDLLLLETGFLAILLTPIAIMPQFPPVTAPSRVILWLFWWLLFRLMFSSGVMKLRHGDTSWRNLTALRHHYETQPLPTRMGWMAHQLPLWCHQTSTVIMFAIELVAPFLIFAPVPLRHLAAAMFLVFMALIQLTGNYGIFNLLGGALAVLLFDDKILLPVFQKLCGVTLPMPFPSGSPGIHWTVATLAVLILALSFKSLLCQIRGRPGWPGSLARLFDLLEPFRLVNSYGLFAVMTRGRPEIIIEGSEDGVNWREYEFKWKPGDVKRAPRFAGPHLPRLDWQMWFAAQEPETRSGWFDRFLERLLTCSPSVLSLLRKDPFPQGPPRHIRVVSYGYCFTNWKEHSATQHWWQRQPRLTSLMMAHSAGKR